MTAAADFRKALIERLLQTLEPDYRVEAIFEAGSAATGRLDAFSDVDWMIVASLSDAESLFGSVETAAQAVAPITHRWNVDPVGFRDMAQRLYLFRDAPPFFMLDCVIVSPAGVDQFLERERHGEPRVHLDRAAIIRPKPIDSAQWTARRTQRLEQLRGLVPVYGELVAKELARGHAIEAFGFYQVLVRALIEAIGLHERRDRFDFAWRYIETDFSPDSQRLVASFTFVANANDLEERRRALVDALREQLAECSP